MGFRRIDALVSDVMRQSKDRAAREAASQENERTPTTKAGAELPGCMGGVANEPPAEENAATIVPGVRKRSRSSDTLIVRPPTVKRGRIRPTVSAAPALGVRPRFAANDNHSADSFSGAGV